MIKSALVFTIALGLCSTVALAAPVSQNPALNGVIMISSGPEGGGYAKVGYNLKGLMGKGATVHHSHGSVENLDRLHQGTYQLAPVQMDAYAKYTDDNPGTAQSYDILGPLYEECVFIAYNKEGPITSESDLQKKGKGRIAIGKEGSGTSYTWDYMRTLEPDFRNTPIMYGYGSRVLAKLAAQGHKAKKGVPNAVMFVTAPDTQHKLIQAVLKNPKLAFLEIDDNQLNNKHPETGEAIYRKKSIDVKKGWGGGIQTICVDAALLGSASAPEKVLDKAADLMMNYRESVVD